jgi:hypothetical protein
MNHKRKRIAPAPALLLVAGMLFLGGCHTTFANPSVLETFVADLLQNAAAAWLL